eukprot:TRINITY_DN5845_c0_g1_i1.p3 TRINITY_DN5845_c0_g1~~TRINITY_DN5845_c0_g1_i1.p3  ORF type:complete len:217 (+),score=-19.71 TRINITY_DN5845_c0_g1_i1:262-912(+)
MMSEHLVSLYVIQTFEFFKKKVCYNCCNNIKYQYLKSMCFISLVPYLMSKNMHQNNFLIRVVLQTESNWGQQGLKKVLFFLCFYLCYDVLLSCPTYLCECHVYVVKFEYFIFLLLLEGLCLILSQLQHMFESGCFYNCKKSTYINKSLRILCSLLFQVLRYHNFQFFYSFYIGTCNIHCIINYKVIQSQQEILCLSKLDIMDNIQNNLCTDNGCRK